MTSAVNGKMIFISDLEGCPDTIFKGPQSVISCSDLFFKKLDLFLEKNILNKVVFLGDYFDKGQHFIESINNIINLYDKYNKFEYNTKKVYIILGNRDINKLRLLFEYNNIDLNNILIEDNLNNSNLNKSNSNKLKECKDKFLEKKLNLYIDPYVKWDVWNAFYINYINNLKVSSKKNNNITNNRHERLKTILKDSMGADQGENNSFKMVNEYYDNIFINETKNVKNLNEMAKRQKLTRQKLNFWKLFKYGNIIDYDSEYKVLLSHAGGMGSFQFHNEKYYNNITKKFKSYNDGNILNYFHNIEVARRGLMIRPVGDELYVFESKNKNLHVPDLLKIINSPLRNFINTIFENSMVNPFPRKTNINLTNDFFLLQALGLKPDSVENNNFTSFVQSCDYIYCKGPTSNNIGNSYKSVEYDKFLHNLTQYLNVKFVAFGHNPVCTPVPLVYKREGKDIVFIGNDLTNYHDKNTDSIDNIPLSYIVKLSNNSSVNEFKVGVNLFNKIVPSNTNTSKNTSNNLPGSLKDFKPMLKEWNFKNVPYFDDNDKTIIINNDSKLTFPSREKNSLLPYKPVIIITKKKNN